MIDGHSNLLNQLYATSFDIGRYRHINFKILKKDDFANEINLSFPFSFKTMLLMKNCNYTVTLKLMITDCIVHVSFYH